MIHSQPLVQNKLSLLTFLTFHRSYLLLAGQEEDVAVHTIFGAGLRVAGYHRKQTLLSICCAEENAMESVGHDKLDRRGEEGMEGRNER